MKWNNRAKLIASAGNPLYNDFASRAEVKEAKLLARGHYWENTWAQDGERDFTEFVAFSPSGMRYYFEFNWFSWGTKRQRIRWKKEARAAARLWARGRIEQARDLAYSSYERSHE